MSRKHLYSPTLAETAHSHRNPQSIRGVLACLTAAAVAVTLLVATALPVSAARTGAVCAQPLLPTGLAAGSCHHNP